MGLIDQQSMPAILVTNILVYLHDSGRREKIARRRAGVHPSISMPLFYEFATVCKKVAKIARPRINSLTR